MLIQKIIWVSSSIKKVLFWVEKPFQSFDQLWKFLKLPRLGMIVRGLTQPVEQDKLLLLNKKRKMKVINKSKS